LNAPSTEYDIGENGTTFEVLFRPNKGIDNKATLFDFYDAGENGIRGDGDDRQMRLWNTRSAVKVTNGKDTFQNQLTFEWRDGDRDPMADSFRSVKIPNNKKFSFRLRSGMMDDARWFGRWHHVIITVNPQGNWHMWQDGLVVSGYFAQEREYDHSKGSDKTSTWLAHPGYVTAEPPCKYDAAGRKKSCNTKFKQLSIGVSTDNKNAFNGDVAAFRSMKHDVTPDEAYDLYWEGMDHTAYDATKWFEVDWVACRPTKAVGSSCNDFNNNTRNDTCRPNYTCKGEIENSNCTENGQCEVNEDGTITVVDSPSSSSSASGFKSGLIAAVAVGVAVIIVILVFFTWKLTTVKKMAAEASKVLAFENPMYDDDGNRKDVDDKDDDQGTFGEGDYDSPNTLHESENTGYLDVEANNEDEEQEDL
jgi:hypothetical protein